RLNLRYLRIEAAPPGPRTRWPTVSSEHLLAEPAVDAGGGGAEGVIVVARPLERLQRAVVRERPDRDPAGVRTEAADAAQHEIQPGLGMTGGARPEGAFDLVVAGAAVRGEVFDAVEPVAVDRLRADDLVVAAAVLQMDGAVGGALG